MARRTGVATGLMVSSVRMAVASLQVQTAMKIFLSAIFIVAFEGLVGMDGTITTVEMQQFADFRVTDYAATQPYSCAG